MSTFLSVAIYENSPNIGNGSKASLLDRKRKVKTSNYQASLLQPSVDDIIHNLDSTLERSENYMTMDNNTKLKKENIG